MAAWSFSRPVCGEVPALPDHFPDPQIKSIPTFDDRTIKIWVYPSQNGAVVISLGGFIGSQGINLPKVDFLLEEGYGIVQVAGRGCADPPGKVTLGYYESYDAEAVLEYVLENGLAEEGKVGVIGFSMGGAAAVQAAARNSGFSAVVAEGGYANLDQNFKNVESPLFDPFFASLSTFFFWLTGVDPKDSSPIDVIDQISPRPILLIYGEHEVVNGKGMEQFDAAQEPKQIWIVPGGAHGSNVVVAAEEYRQRVLEFFNQSLLE